MDGWMNGLNSGMMGEMRLAEEDWKNTENWQQKITG